MKNIYLCLSVCAIFYSCTTNSDLNVPSKNSKFLARESVNDAALDVRANASNPYDSAGRIHNEVLDTYNATTTPPTTIPGIVNRVETIAKSNTAFFAIEGNLYSPLSPDRILYVLNNPFTSRNDVINNSVLSIKAKASINNFIDQVLPICASDSNYAVIYNYVVAYESTILADATLSIIDKKIILTTTSILRYSAYNRKRPKRNTDLDWEINVTHLTGSIDGSSYGTSEAITSALSLGIANHY